MPDRSNLIYQYDGSFEGLLCCIFESYSRHEIPVGITPCGTPQISLYPALNIQTDMQKAIRILRSIPLKMGSDALSLVQRAFLTCGTQKELDILLFLRLGYKNGSRITDMLANDVVDRIVKAVKYLENESHYYKEFLRFSDFNNILVSIIEPNNYVLPMITQHYCERFPCERFLIFDKTHGMALTHKQGFHDIIPLEGLHLPAPDEPEEKMRALWRLFYETIEVPGRHNEKCRMGHMPKHYWRYMTEFGNHITFEDVILEKETDGPLRLL